MNVNLDKKSNNERDIKKINNKYILLLSGGLYKKYQ